jgi:hypothetical protein
MLLRGDPLVATGRGKPNDLYVFGTLHGSNTNEAGLVPNASFRSDKQNTLPLVARVSFNANDF